MYSFQWLEALAHVATTVTAGAVLLAWWQIREAKKQALTTFEDSLAREYREIAQRLPIAALLGEDLDKAQQDKALEKFFHYIDLSNEQAFLRLSGRVSAETWNNWRDGIKSNLSKPAFKKGWEEIKRRAPESFSELRRLEASQFRDDPRNWRN